MCPDLVVADQRIAAENPNVTAHVYDIRHFENLKNQYNVMSVPCLVINNNQVFFGKKNIHEIIELLKELWCISFLEKILTVYSLVAHPKKSDAQLLCTESQIESINKEKIDSFLSKTVDFWWSWWVYGRTKKSSDITGIELAFYTFQRDILDGKGAVATIENQGEVFII